MEELLKEVKEIYKDAYIEVFKKGTKFETEYIKVKNCFNIHIKDDCEYILNRGTKGCMSFKDKKLLLKVLQTEEV